jgi:hypothetical protein
MPLPYQGVPLTATPPTPIQQMLNTIGGAINSIPQIISNLTTYTAPPIQYSPYTQPSGYLQPSPYLPPSNLQTYTPPTYYAQSIVSGQQSYSGGPINVNVQPTPVNIVVNPTPVNINIPSMGSTTLEGMMKQILNMYVPGASQVLSTTENIAQALAPVLGPILNPMVTTLQSMQSNFEKNFTAMADVLRLIMEKSGLNATTDFKAYNDFAHSAVEFIRDTANKIALQDNTSITDAIHLIGTQVDKYDSVIKATLDQIKASQEAEVKARDEALKNGQKDVFSLLITVLTAIAHFMSAPQQNLNKTLGLVVSDVQEPISKSVEGQKEKLDAVINKIQAGKYSSWHEALDDFNKLAGNSWLLQGVINLVIILTMPARAILAGSEPLAKELSHLANAEHPLQLLDAMSYIVYLFRNPTQGDWVNVQLHKLGLSNEQISVLISSAIRILQPQDIISAQLRGFIDEKTRDRLLGDNGYDSESKALLAKLSKVLPPIQDLTRIADKRVWGLKLDSKFGQFTEMPREYADFMAQHGIDTQFTEWIWAAHWSLPSPNMIFDAEHRGLLKPGDMDGYLALTDYVPYFRDILKQISYNVLGRIDIRRIYKAGGKSVDWLKRHYEADGYNPQDVQDLVDWTVNTQLPEDETELTKLENKLHGLIESKYIDGTIDATNARNMLKYLNRSDDYINRALPILDLIRSFSTAHNDIQDLSARVRKATIDAKTKGHISNIQAKRLLLSTAMPEAQVDLSLHYAELQYTIALKAKAEDTYKTQYALHNINETEFRNSLSGYEFMPDEIDRAFLEADLMRVNKTKKPTEAQLEKWYNDKVIDDSQLQEELRGLGLSERYVQYIYNDLSKGKVQ